MHIFSHLLSSSRSTFKICSINLLVPWSKMLLIAFNKALHIFGLLLFTINSRHDYRTTTFFHFINTKVRISVIIKMMIQVYTYSTPKLNSIWKVIAMVNQTTHSVFPDLHLKFCILLAMIWAF